MNKKICISIILSILVLLLPIMNVFAHEEDSHNHYHIGYEPGEGSGIMEDTKGYEPGEEVFVMPNAFVAPDGKIFAGFALVPESRGEGTANIEYALNDGSTRCFRVVVPTDALYTISDITELLSARSTIPTFLGWNNRTDGTGTHYSPGTQITVTGDIILYGQWGTEVDDLYSISYDANGGEGVLFTDPTLYPAGSNYTVLDSNAVSFTKDDFSFSHWNTEQDGNGLTYVAGDTFTINGDITLYAQWEAVPSIIYSVVYDANSGDGSHIDVGISYGSVYYALSVEDTGISKNGYLLACWNTQADGSGVVYVPGDEINITDNLYLYAQWTEDPNAVRYSITYFDLGIPYNAGQYLAGEVITILNGEECGFDMTGRFVMYWVDQNYTSRYPGDRITVTEDLILVSIWNPLFSSLSSYDLSPTSISLRSTEHTIYAHQTDGIPGSADSFIINENMTLVALWKSEENISSSSSEAPSSSSGMSPSSSKSQSTSPQDENSLVENPFTGGTRASTVAVIVSGLAAFGTAFWISFLRKGDEMVEE